MSVVAFPRDKGFTLIELMVTVAVMAITLTVAVPAFTQLINGNRLTSQANEVLSALSYARSEAIRRNDDVVFCHSPNGTSCSAPSGNWQGWILFAASDPAVILASGRFNTQLRVIPSSNLANAAHALRYNSQGFIRQQANANLLTGSLRICHPSGRPEQNSRDVRFISGGRVTVTSVIDASCSRPGD
ncbi:GspH/FimT family pseudopilin [Alkalimonas delamerensis]|uniref:Type II secretion system protein H n=1 Tax=Alkalimonas delamerensis TaxID=265981 RepID=A0ABT9GS11_9GAMM|nr:GspH/FimT family pseudopilin [Alkalimonas delamerensis]MDP4529753.1 GspH/FimT family pseudopilin [Alkalimonas delamerensis]